MAQEPTEIEMAAEVRRIEALRAARAAEKAKVDPDARPTPDLSKLSPMDFTAGGGPPRLTADQVGEFVEAMRATYASFDYDAEIVTLKEERLAAALKADGYALPPLPVKDRLRALMARQRRRQGD